MDLRDKIWYYKTKTKDIAKLTIGLLILGVLCGLPYFVAIHNPLLGVTLAFISMWIITESVRNH